MINMNNVYIQKSIYSFWEPAMPFWEFYTRTCNMEKRNPNVQVFLDTLKSLDYEVKNLGENPSVIDYLRIGMKVDAMKKYKELHKVTLMEAKKAVEKILDNMWKDSNYE